MDNSIRRLQITAVTVVTLAVGLGGFRLFSVVAKAKDQGRRPVAAVQPTPENETVKYGKYIMSL
jgi:hypothetical protein